MRDIVKDFCTQFSQTLEFEGLCWWIIDLVDDPDHFVCNKTMVNAFRLDPTAERYSIEEFCPIAGDLNDNVASCCADAATNIQSDYLKLMSQQIKEYSNVFPYRDVVSGVTKYFTSRARVLSRQSDGDIELLYGILWDVTEAEHNRLELQQLSNQDFLTGLKNRRYFQAVYEHELTQAKRNQNMLGLIMIDVDCFKAYNDAYGHSAGDSCLSAIAEVIGSSVLRESDVVARYGGEEFVVLCPNIDSSDVMLLIERIRTNLDIANIPHLASTVAERITVSIGAVAIDQFVNVSSPLDKADQQLYLAKHAGRDTYRFACVCAGACQAAELVDDCC